MENLNREAILRMLSGKTGNSSSGGGGGDIDLAGYATMIWVTENFVSIDFFRELFRAYDSNSQEILPNDTTSVVASIKAMVGTWTEEYLTALGNAGGGGGGGGGAQYLNDLLDVQLTTPLTDGQALVYNATLQKWVNGAAGVNMTTVWNALAGSTNEQINASHLSTALSGYVTTSAISDMATQTWVGQQGFATKTWVTSNFITIAYFDRLFRAYNNSTLVSHNDTTTTIDNIKAMFGFWTDFYLSALGTGGVSSVSISLSQLADVNVAGVTNGQVLSYNSTDAEWVPTTISNVTSLSALTDVSLSSPTTYQVLMYDASSTKWYNSALKTINGYSIIGTGDINVGGGGGSYLPLSGGTITGTITFNNNDTAALASQSGWNQLMVSDYYTILGFDNPYHNIDTYIDGTKVHIRGSNGDRILAEDNMISITGEVRINRATQASYIIQINGINRGLFSYHESIGTFMYNYYADDAIYLANNGRTGIGVSSPLYKLDVNGDAQIRGWLRTSGDAGWYSETYGGGWYMVDSDWIRSFNNKYVWVNTYLCAQHINAGGSYTNFGYALQANGDIYATGAVTALSDIRHKTVIKDAAVSVEDIARMPAVMYQWNDGREDKELHVGSIAQDWQRVLPEVVLKANDKEGTLSMQYGVAALVSSIIIARKVVNHEDRIKQLEKENKELKKRLNIA